MGKSKKEEELAVSVNKLNMAEPMLNPGEKLLSEGKVIYEDQNLTTFMYLAPSGEEQVYEPAVEKKFEKVNIWDELPAKPGSPRQKLRGPKLEAKETDQKALLGDIQHRLQLIEASLSAKSRLETLLEELIHDFQETKDLLTHVQQLISLMGEKKAKENKVYTSYTKRARFKTVNNFKAFYN
ncbi:MAG: hypothetical protein ACOYBM_03950 [Dethiobacteria bacterium]|jgi:hypothetical protein